MSDEKLERIRRATRREQDEELRRLVLSRIGDTSIRKDGRPWGEPVARPESSAA